MGDGKLIFFCGKMAAGKSTLARHLVETAQGVLLSEDEFLERLYPGEILEVGDYARLSRRLRDSLEDLVVSLLRNGSTVVLDFPGNNGHQRDWFRTLIERSGARHELHYVDVPNEVCLRQLRQRSAHLQDDAPWTSDDAFVAVTKFFEEPSPDERFNVIRHPRHC